MMMMMMMMMIMMMMMMLMMKMMMLMLLILMMLMMHQEHLHNDSVFNSLTVRFFGNHTPRKMMIPSNSTNLYTLYVFVCGSAKLQRGRFHLV